MSVELTHHTPTLTHRTFRDEWANASFRLQKSGVTVADVLNEEAVGKLPGEYRLEGARCASANYLAERANDKPDRCLKRLFKMAP